MQVISSGRHNKRPARKREGGGALAIRFSISGLSDCGIIMRLSKQQGRRYPYGPEKRVNQRSPSAASNASRYSSSLLLATMIYCIQTISGQ